LSLAKIHAATKESQSAGSIFQQTPQEASNVVEILCVESMDCCKSSKRAPQKSAAIVVSAHTFKGAENLESRSGIRANVTAGMLALRAAQHATVWRACLERMAERDHSEQDPSEFRSRW